MVLKFYARLGQAFIKSSRPSQESRFYFRRFTVIILRLTVLILNNEKKNSVIEPIFDSLLFGVKIILEHVESFQNIFVIRKLLKMFEGIV